MINRARSLLRRRHSVTEDQTELDTVDSIERSAFSLRTTERTPSMEHPFSIRRRARLHRRDASTASPSSLERETADSISRNMTKRWFGVEERFDSREQQQVALTGTRYVRSWLDGQPPVPSDQSSESATPPNPVASDASPSPVMSIIDE